VATICKVVLGRLRAVEAANRDIRDAVRRAASPRPYRTATRGPPPRRALQGFGPNVTAYWDRLRQREGLPEGVAAEQSWRRATLAPGTGVIKTGPFRGDEPRKTASDRRRLSVKSAPRSVKRGARRTHHGRSGQQLAI